MKTWFSFLPVLIVMAVLPFLLGLIPTWEMPNGYVGGGPIMEWSINWVASWAPNHIAVAMAGSFERTGSFWVYFPLALCASAVNLTVSYGVCLAIMTGYNKNKIKQYEKQRQLVKGV